MMLSAVIMTKIATVLEEVVHVYAEQRTSRPKSDPGDRHPQHRDSEAFCDLFVGDYPINSESEWASVMKALIVTLSKRMLDLLERMKGVAEAEGREIQLQMLWGVEQRAKRITGTVRDNARAE